MTSSVVAIWTMWKHASSLNINGLSNFHFTNLSVLNATKLSCEIKFKNCAILAHLKPSKLNKQQKYFFHCTHCFLCALREEWILDYCKGHTGGKRINVKKARGQVYPYCLSSARLLRRHCALVRCSVNGDYTSRQLWCPSYEVHTSSALPRA